MNFVRRIGRAEDFADAFQKVVTYFRGLRRRDPERFAVEFAAFIADGKRRGGKSGEFAATLEEELRQRLSDGAK